MGAQPWGCSQLGAGLGACGEDGWHWFCPGRGAREIKASSCHQPGIWPGPHASLTWPPLHDGGPAATPAPGPVTNVSGPEWGQLNLRSCGALGCWSVPPCGVREEGARGWGGRRGLRPPFPESPWPLSPRPLGSLALLTITAFVVAAPALSTQGGRGPGPPPVSQGRGGTPSPHQALERWAGRAGWAVWARPPPSHTG